MMKRIAIALVLLVVAGALGFWYFSKAGAQIEWFNPVAHFDMQRDAENLSLYRDWDQSGFQAISKSLSWHDSAIRDSSSLDPHVPARSLLKGLPPGGPWVEMQIQENGIWHDVSTDQFKKEFAPVTSADEAVSFLYILDSFQSKLFAHIKTAATANGYYVWLIYDTTKLSFVPSCGSTARVTLGQVYFINKAGDVSIAAQLVREREMNYSGPCA